MIRRLILAAALSAVAVTASASEKKAQPAASAYVDLDVMALPIIRDGRVVNYAFVSSRINLTATADAAKLRAREPYFRDAMVRAAHKVPLNPDKDVLALDAARFKATLTRVATAVAGPGNVASVELTKQAPFKRLRQPVS